MVAGLRNDIGCNTLLAAGLRFGLIVYGLWQDAVMVVKYTDIDYHVFTDAARFMTQGESPYKRATYRYTPLLAGLLQPNIYCSAIYGKILFSLGDVLAGYLIYKILTVNGHTESVALRSAQLWLFNPLPMTVSTRGNAESIMAVLVLTTIWLLMACRSHLATAVAGLVYGVAVHVKIYPVTYALPVYLYLNSRRLDSHRSTSSCRWLLPTWDSFIFGVLSALTLGALTYFYYVSYGDEFLHHTYLYHVTRKDIRHNFSPYFYLLYLSSYSPDGATSLLGLAAFIPQMALMVAVSLRFRRDLEFACFLQTAIFVTFNKVCTTQYFLWYLCLLPLSVPQLVLSLTDAGSMFLVWLMGQGVWLLPAYYLEIQGINTYVYVWLAGLVFFLVNVGLLCQLILRYKSTRHYLVDSTIVNSHKHD